MSTEHDDPGAAATLLDLPRTEVDLSAPRARVPPPTPSGASLIADPDQDFESREGEERYQLRRTLGEGGMGEVRLCRDRHIGREVAVKVMHAAHRGEGELGVRFLREARVQGQLEHPSIVPVYDIGRNAAGEAFFAMRRVRGETLEDVLQRLRDGDEVARTEHSRHKLLAAFVRVCLALDYAHSRGVVHRDLKPSNVMIGRFGEVYLLDWGIAKVKGATHADVSPRSIVEEETVDAKVSGQTQVGSVLGTPGYMAPEQVGMEQEIDARADVYALGAILFEILALEPLNGGAPPRVLLTRTLAGLDGRPSVRAPDRDVPPELERICVKATATKPSERYASARELADGVESFLSGDRDLTLRRDLAALHVARASESSARALASEDGAARAEALGELGQALGLDPAHDEARRLLVSLLTEPPKVAPPAVLAAVHATSVERLRTVLPWTAAAYVGIWFLLVPIALMIGIRNVWMFALPCASWTLAALAAYVTSKSTALLESRVPFAMIAAAWAAAATSCVAGPFVIVPMLVTVSALGHLLADGRQKRVTVLVLAALAFLLPVAASWGGVHPVVTTFDGEAMVIAVRAFALPRHGTYVLLVVTHVALFIGVAGFVLRYRHALQVAELRERLQAWQVEQLVPKAAVSERR